MDRHTFFATCKWTAMGAVLALATGCASESGLYQWGGYDTALYSAYKNPGNVVTLQTKLEQHIAAMGTARQKVAPGLHAELGSLYLQAGRNDEAIAQYRLERALWPESQTLMDALIQTLENRNKKPGGTGQKNTEAAS
ncbi:DUF4810 domain-containing protein [Diaphorobacter aerolatus]|uniref:DUF4810 domain-containing protein n=1 Tax=Diaphorobacter aerolatus TaxID=1288495 RepID=A0A7H0GG46_9BURK|nr:DUF4810 domain-containing protein [Diaphorobacter aerolatus]QNP47262.1 DUF4810 domain-containing protein [Diaphorobacter aerolatus]